MTTEAQGMVMICAGELPEKEPIEQREGALKKGEEE